MVLVDTSAWIDHLRAGSRRLTGHLEQGSVLGHPWVTGELALGNLSQRREILTLLGSLPQANLATPDEVLSLIEGESLQGLGIGYVDAQLIAATRLTPGATLWTRDKRLAAAAERLGIGSRT